MRCATTASTLAQRCGAVRYARASSDPRASRSTTAAAPAVWRPACIYSNEKRNFSATRLDKIGIRISVRLTNGSDLSSQHEYFFAHHDLRRGVHPRLCGVVLCHAERLEWLRSFITARILFRA